MRLREGRGIAVAVAASLGVLVVGVLVVRALTGGSDPQPAPASSSRPNIVLILTDDQTYESVANSSLGVMPYLEGRPDWIRFTNAFQEVSLCCPARATLLTGQYSTHTGVTDNSTGKELDESQTLATWLHDAGYRTGLIGKYLNAYPFGRGDYVPPGWDDWRVFTGDDEGSRADVGYFDYSLNENGKIVHYGEAAEDYATDVEARQSVDFIESAREPFFLQVAPKAPHSPWTPPPRYESLPFEITHSPSFDEPDVSDKPGWLRSLAPVDEPTQDKRRLEAYRTLRAVDDLVREVFGALESTGVLDNTIVVFMTDNGFAFGEHRWATKRCPYDECMRSPMLVHYPGQPGREVDALVQNVDMASTFAEIAGVTPSIPQDGTSLVPLLTGSTTSGREALLLRWAGGDGNGRGQPGSDAYLPPFWGVRTAHTKYIEYENGERELYDLDADPFELVNRADDPALEPLQTDLAATLTTLKAAAD